MVLVVYSIHWHAICSGEWVVVIALLVAFILTEIGKYEDRLPCE